MTAARKGRHNLKFETILFDLDGTLTDPGLGITNSIRYAMEQRSMPPLPREQLYRFIGPPLLEEFQRVFGVSRAESEAMLAEFRVYFEKTGIWENRLYPGVPEMLARLKEHGCRLVLATSKPEVFAVQILEHFDLFPYFDAVAGSDLDETRTAKGEVIAYALHKAGGSGSAIMVGDRRHDVLGARENGLDALGVLYGYGNREELERAGARYLAGQVEEIAGILL